jgi:hypothetical protein
VKIGDYSISPKIQVLKEEGVKNANVNVAIATTTIVIAKVAKLREVMTQTTGAGVTCAIKKEANTKR